MTQNKIFKDWRNNYTNVDTIYSVLRLQRTYMEYNVLSVITYTFS